MLNNVIIAGRLTSDPTTRVVKTSETDEGITLHSFSIAVDSIKGDEAYFFDCTIFNEKVASLLHKGDKIAVIGSLRQRKYKAKDGSTRVAIDILVDNVDFINVAKKVEE